MEFIGNKKYIFLNTMILQSVLELMLQILKDGKMHYIKQYL